MEMQDNEFDDLFRSKLDGFEAAPADRVWMGIENKLDQKRAAVKWLPVLKIAAGLLVVCSMGIVLTHHLDKNVKLQAGIKHITKEATKAMAQTPVPVNPVVMKPTRATNITKSPALAVAQPVSISRTTNSTLKAIRKTKPADKQEPVSRQDDQMLLASASPDRADLKDPRGTDQTATPATGPTVLVQPEFITQTPVRPDAIPGSVQHITDKPAARHKIKSLGDMLNVVIAKVDKRKDKFIEFSNTDDDESSITGINIGILKIKKDK